MNPAINVHNGARKPDQKSDRPQQQVNFDTSDPKQKKPKKGKSLLKIIGIILLVIFLIIVGTIYFVYQVGSATVNMLDEAANAPVTQSIENVNGRTIIHLPLQKEYGMTIYGYSGCYKQGTPMTQVSSSSTCINGNCKIVVTIKPGTPKTFELNVEEGNECVRKEFTLNDDIEIVNYFVTLEIDDALKNALDITEPHYNVSSKNSRQRSSFQFMGTKKVTLNYETNPPSQDTLLIDEQPKATLQFD